MYHDEAVGPASQGASAGERELVARLRAGDEGAFEALIDRYHRSLLRLAMLYVPSYAIAEEVVQETWLGVLQGLSRFEGRSSLRTWIFRILTNRARTRGQREGRSIPFSAVWNPEGEAAEPAVEADRFLPPEHASAGHWMSHPHNWDALPEERLLGRETRAQIQQAIDALPGSQREVITLRDVEGWSSEEVCNILNISEPNQRVLLHRARSKVRRALERYLDSV
jgi:RNA polymerase sigma-70 factor (ECF subfamily)